MSVFPLVGVLGKKRHGKNSAADVLAAEAGFELAAYADPLKEAALALNPIVGANIPLPDDHSPTRIRRLVDVVDALGWERAKEYVPEVRRTLARLGTDAVRRLDYDFWVRITAARMDERIAPLAITDVRFPNEAKAITDRGGILVRVVRPDAPVDPDPHLSETALDGYPVDVELVNDGTLSDLAELVRSSVLTRLFPS